MSKLKHGTSVAPLCSHHDLIQREVTHDFAAVHVSSDAGDGAGFGVLPHDIFHAIVQHGTVTAVACNHEVIVGEKTGEMTVVEVVVGVEQWFATVELCHLLNEASKVFNECLFAHRASVFDVNDGHKVLLVASNH